MGGNKLLAKLKDQRGSSWEVTEEARIEEVEMQRAEARVLMASAEQKAKVEKVEGEAEGGDREDVWVEKARGEGTLRRGRLRRADVGGDWRWRRWRWAVATESRGDGGEGAEKKMVTEAAEKAEVGVRR